MDKQKILDVLNSLEVVDQEGGDSAYMLVGNNVGNRELLNAVGIEDDEIHAAGDEETFCILAFAFNGGYADDYEDGKLVTWGSIDDDLRNRVAHGDGKPSDGERLLKENLSLINTIESLQEEKVKWAIKERYLTGAASRYATKNGEQEKLIESQKEEIDRLKFDGMAWKANANGENARAEKAELRIESLKAITEQNNEEIKTGIAVHIEYMHTNKRLAEQVDRLVGGIKLLQDMIGNQSMNDARLWGIYTKLCDLVPLSEIERLQNEK